MSYHSVTLGGLDTESPSAKHHATPISGTICALHIPEFGAPHGQRRARAYNRVQGHRPRSVGHGTNLPEAERCFALCTTRQWANFVIKTVLQNKIVSSDILRREVMAVCPGFASAWPTNFSNFSSCGVTLRILTFTTLAASVPKI